MVQWEDVKGSPDPPKARGAWNQGEAPWRQVRLGLDSNRRPERVARS